MTESAKPDLQASLQASIDQAEWAWLSKHAERDVVICVSLEIPLLEVAVKIAEDDQAAVQAWVTGGKLSKPTRAQLDAWGAQPTKLFMSVVVQPYVLVQEILHS